MKGWVKLAPTKKSDYCLITERCGKKWRKEDGCVQNEDRQNEELQEDKRKARNAPWEGRSVKGNEKNQCREEERLIRSDKKMIKWGGKQERGRTKCSCVKYRTEGGEEKMKTGEGWREQGKMSRAEKANGIKVEEQDRKVILGLFAANGETWRMFGYWPSV